MATLFVLSGPDIGRSFDVADGAVVGRAEGCEVRVRDASVSRRHARLERGEAGWAVVDLGSRNGLRGPRGRVERLPLDDGDTFHLGELELRFRARVAAPPAREEPGGTLDTLTLGAAAAAAPQVQAPPPPEDPLEVEEIVLEGPDGPPAPPPRAPRPAVAGERAAAARAAKEAELARARAQAASRTGRGAAPARAGAGGGQLRAEVAREVLQYSRVADRPGFFGSDLAQQPAWVKLLVGAVALAFAAVLFLLAFRGTALLKGRVQDGGAASEGYEEPE